MNDIKKMRTTEIATLDRPFLDDQGKQASVRERMMGFRLHKYPNRCLFHSVGKSYDGSNVIVTFVPDREDEACASVAGILPRLIHECGSQVKKTFQPDAVALHSKSRWDAATCQVRMKDDDRVAAVENADEEMLCGKTKEKVHFHFENIKDVRQGGPDGKPDVQGGKDPGSKRSSTSSRSKDSVSTLNGGGARRTNMAVVLEAYGRPEPSPHDWADSSLASLSSLTPQDTTDTSHVARTASRSSILGHS